MAVVVRAPDVLLNHSRRQRHCLADHPPLIASQATSAPSTSTALTSPTPTGPELLWGRLPGRSLGRCPSLEMLDGASQGLATALISHDLHCGRVGRDGAVLRQARILGVTADLSAEHRDHLVAECERSHVRAHGLDHAGGPYRRYTADLIAKLLIGSQRVGRKVGTPARIPESAGG